MRIRGGVSDLLSQLLYISFIPYLRHQNLQKIEDYSRMSVQQVALYGDPGHTLRIRTAIQTTKSSMYLSYCRPWTRSVDPTNYIVNTNLLEYLVKDAAKQHVLIPSIIAFVSIV